MAQGPGWFDETTRPGGWFDETAYREGQFDVTAIPAGAAGPVTISGKIGAYTWRGIAGSIAVSIALGVGAYTWSGVKGAIAAEVSGKVGTYTWAGVKGSIATEISGKVGAYTWAGVKGSLSKEIAGNVGAWTWAGVHGNFGSGPITVNGTVGAYSWAGIGGSFPSIYIVNGTIGTYSWAGITGQLVPLGTPSTCFEFDAFGFTLDQTGQRWDQTICPVLPVATVGGGSGKKRRNEVHYINGQRWLVPKEKVSEFLAQLKSEPKKPETVEIPTPVDFPTIKAQSVRISTHEKVEDDLGMVMLPASLAGKGFDGELVLTNDTINANDEIGIVMVMAAIYELEF